MYAGSLASFLIGATEYDYYACTKGWGFDMGWGHWFADYDRPLGSPTGAAVHTSGHWYRKFSSGTQVWLDPHENTDTSWGSSCIKWSDGAITQSNNFCHHV